MFLKCAKVGLLPSLVAIALLGGCDKLAPPQPSNNPPADITNPETPESPREIPRETPPKVPTAEADITNPSIYWLRTETGGFALEPQTIPPSEEDPEATLQALFAELTTAEPPSEDLASAIPPETQLLAVAVEGKGITVNLSEDFTFGGGSASMIGRLGQVIYTATSLDPDASVWLQVEGEPLTILGGEGLEIAQPITRDIFTQEFEL